jgi:hypothetical protein
MTRLSRRGIIWLLPNPLRPLLSASIISLCVSPVDLTDGSEGGGWGRSQIIRHREAWSSITHSILSSCSSPHLQPICSKKRKRNRSFIQKVYPKILTASQHRRNSYLPLLSLNISPTVCAPYSSRLLLLRKVALAPSFCNGIQISNRSYRFATIVCKNYFFIKFLRKVVCKN